MEKSFSVREHLLHLVGHIDPNSNLVGTLSSGHLCMPLKSEDGRELTWTKFVQNISSELVNSPPTSILDCWFVPANNADGTRTKKIASKGGENKFQVHRIMTVLLHPKYHSLVEDKGGDDHFAHRCGRGKGMMGCCINPYHIVVTTGKINQDHKGCKYGCRALCPHDPPCFFTWHDTGLVKPCFMLEQGVSSNCPHPRKCKHVIA